MLFDKIKQSKLHKLFLSITGTIQDVDPITGFSKPMLYRWFRGEKVDPQSVPRIIDNIDRTESNLMEILKHLTKDYQPKPSKKRTIKRIWVNSSEWEKIEQYINDEIL